MQKYVLTGVTHPGRFELEPGFNTIGRNPTNDFRISDSTVSSFHCEIVVSVALIMVRDLGSTNGTFIDDQRVTEAPLAAGQTLRLGSAELRLDGPGRPAAEPAPVQIPQPAAEPSPALAGGGTACVNHSQTAATMKCSRCDRAFCDDCIHVLRLAGGRTRLFCPSCSGLCVALPGVDSAASAGEKPKQSLLGRLSQTIRIRFK